MDFLTPPQALADLLPEAVKGSAQLIWYGVLGVVGLLVLIVVGVVLKKIFGGGKRKKFKEDDPLREDLAQYPPPPKAGPRKLAVQGSSARVRLVVIAPVGKSAKIDADKASGLLEHVVRGLGAVAGQDKPRIKVWPPQLSNEGFTETFFRVVKSPDKAGKSSRWTLLAGKAKVGESYILLGLGLLTDEATNLGVLRPKPDGWGDHLRVKS
jgi:hypothetical protein